MHKKLLIVKSGLISCAVTFLCNTSNIYIRAQGCVFHTTFLMYWCLIKYSCEHWAPLPCNCSPIPNNLKSPCGLTWQWDIMFTVLLYQCGFTFEGLRPVRETHVCCFKSPYKSPKRLTFLFTVFFTRDKMKCHHQLFDDWGTWTKYNSKTLLILFFHK